MLNRFLRAGRKRLARSPLFPAATGANKGPGRGMPPGEKRGLRLTGRVLRAAGVPSGAAPDNTPWDFEVRIATPGYSREGRWFLSREVLREAAPLFEGAQAFANHAEGGAPDIRSLVGWHRNVRMVESDLHSTFAVARSAGWFQALAQDALARGIEEPFGFSFDVVAQTEYREEEGGLVLHFQKIVAVNSVDVVHKGRLGGRPPGPRRGRSAGYRGGGDGEIVQKTQGGRTGGRRQTRREMDAAAADLGLRESGPRFGSRAERRRHGKRKSPSDPK